MPGGGALFGSSATGPGSTGGNKHIIEMKAGKMNLKGRMVYPDKRKGLLYVYQSEDSLMHFCWQDRATGVIEDDLIIFPDDCEYVKVTQCTTGRVYLLRFKSSSRRFFFWYQDPNTEKDEETCRRINEVLNNPQSVQPQSQPQESELQSLLNNMSQSQIMQLFGGQIGLSSLLGSIRGPSGGSARTSTTTPAITHRTVPSTPITTTNTSGAATTTPPATTTPQTATTTVATPEAPRANRHAARTSETTPTGAAGATSNPIQLSDLQNFLQGFTPAAGQQQQQHSVDLSTALTTEALSGVLANTEALQQLQSHLPPVDGDTQEALRSTLASPQFQQAVSQFSSALESGQLAPVVSQLAVNPEAVAAAAQGNMQEFVKALEKNASTSDKGDKAGDKAKKDDKDDDDQMQLD